MGHTAGSSATMDTSVSTIADMIEPLSQGTVAGFIDGVEHTSAWTCGDGSCGLHALFGTSSSGQLCAAGIRSVLVSELTGQLSVMMRSLSSHVCKVLLTEVLDNVWREVKDTAKILMQQGTPEEDASIIWECVSESLKEEVLGFVDMRMLETQNEAILTETFGFCDGVFPACARGNCCQTFVRSFELLAA